MREMAGSPPDRRDSFIAWGFYGVFLTSGLGSGSGLHEVSLFFFSFDT